MNYGFCCTQLGEAVVKFDGPVGLGVNGVLFMALYNLTPSKKAVSRAGRKYVDIYYCPFCGTKIGTEKA